MYKKREVTLSKRKLIIFDFDGTLVDTTPSYYQAAKYAAEKVFNDQITYENALNYAKILELTGDPIQALVALEVCEKDIKSKSKKFFLKWVEAFDGSTTQLLKPMN
ncbi:MAG: HAD family hydrolase, partial [Candidatus Hodarchaeota archaeon]